MIEATPIGGPGRTQAAFNATRAGDRRLTWYRGAHAVRLNVPIVARTSRAVTWPGVVALMNPSCRGRGRP